MVYRLFRRRLFPLLPSGHSRGHADGKEGKEEEEERKERKEERRRRRRRRRGRGREELYEHTGTQAHRHIQQCINTQYYKSALLIKPIKHTIPQPNINLFT